MSVGWRSSTISTAGKYCLRALDHQANGDPYDRSVFTTGTSAHAVLEDIGKESSRRGDYLTTEEAEEVARATCEKLIMVGRDFEGEPEPPLSSDQVWAGRDLAMAYHRDVPLDPRAQYEIGLAVNRQWLPCPYDKGAWLRARIDSIATAMPSWLDDEDMAGPMLEVRDFKSGYPDDERALRSLQRKIQACLAWPAFGRGHAGMRLVILNFRLKREFTLDVFPDTAEGAAVMARWRADIESEIEGCETARLPDGRRPASPGPQCPGCPYLGQCHDAQAWLGTVYGSAAPEELARFYAVAVAQVQALSKPLRHATAESPIMVDDIAVGYRSEEQRALVKDAPERLAAVYLKKVRPRDMDAALALFPGLLTALKLGVAQVEALLTHLYKGDEEQREKRAGILATLITKKFRREFGISRPDVEEEGEE